MATAVIARLPPVAIGVGANGNGSSLTGLWNLVVLNAPVVKDLEPVGLAAVLAWASQELRRAAPLSIISDKRR